MALSIEGTSFASESVTEGHPDKVADSISDLILTVALQFGKQQGTLKSTRVACETLVRRNTIIIAGEIKLLKSNGSLLPVKEIPAALDLTNKIVSLVKSIGYTGEFAQGFDVDDKNFDLIYMLEEQSPDIGNIVSNDEVVGAGDQGLMFGFACNETPSLMPMPIALAHLLTQKLTHVRKTSDTALGPDAKSQVIVDYDNNGVPKKIKQLVISTQHINDVSEIRQWLRDQFLPAEIYPQFESLGLDISNLLAQPDKNLKLNFKGKFEIGGPCADCGLTGRKIIVDTYGGIARHGGGAFSGKDPSKVDRSAAYFLRNIARQIVANDWADRCELRLAYVIGEATPMFIDGLYSNLKIEKSSVNEFLDQQLNQPLSTMLDKYDLWNFDYTKSTNYGHFGRNGLPWEVDSN